LQQKIKADKPDDKKDDEKKSDEPEEPKDRAVLKGLGSLAAA
jgi:hypothetical protein